jgi:hypothetical protein
MTVFGLNMKYALAIIQFAFAFGLFLSATIPASPDNSRFTTTNMMTQTNYLWIIYLAIGIGIIFVGAIVEVKFGKWRHSRRTRNQSAPDIINKSGIDATTETPPTIVVRGYDSGDLFRKDALIRIRELDREIAEDMKPLK